MAHAARVRFRELLNSPETIVVPECYSPLTARIAEDVGFQAVYFGGSGASAMYFGLPDYGLISTPELVGLGRSIATSVSIPVIVDADQGGETALNLWRAVQDFENAGVTAIHVEDSVNPKHVVAGHGRLQSIDEMCMRIRTAIAARSDPDFVIIARSDELYSGGCVEEAIRRGLAYAEAGADIFMCLAMPLDEIDHIAEAIPIPLMTINVSAEQAPATKLKIDAFPGSVYLAAAAYEETLRNILDHGFPASPEFTRQARSRVYDRFLRRDRYLELTDEWSVLKSSDGDSRT